MTGGARENPDFSLGQAERVAVRPAHPAVPGGGFAGKAHTHFCRERRPHAWLKTASAESP